MSRKWYFVSTVILGIIIMIFINTTPKMNSKPIPKTSSMLDLVLGVVAIAGIFAIKKFLINEDKKEYNEITNLDKVDIDKPLEEAE